MNRFFPEIPENEYTKLFVENRVFKEVLNLVRDAFIKWYDCQTAHCGRRKLHFDFGETASPIVPYRYLPQTFSGTAADCRSLV